MIGNLPMVSSTAGIIQLIGYDPAVGYHVKFSRAQPQGYSWPIIFNGETGSLPGKETDAIIKREVSF